MEIIFKILADYIKELKSKIVLLEWERDELQKALDAATADKSARGE